MSDDRTSGLTRLGRWLRLHLLRSIRENASPARTALGLGLGAFVGIYPTFLIGTPLAFFLAGKLGLNRAAAVAGATLSMNPLTAPFLYSLSAWLGFRLLDREVVTIEAEGLWNYLQQYTAPFLVGNTVVALTIAMLLAALMFVWTKRKGGLRAALRKPKRYRAVPSAPAPESAEAHTTVH